MAMTQYLTGAARPLALAAAFLTLVGCGAERTSLRGGGRQDVDARDVDSDADAQPAQRRPGLAPDDGKKDDGKKDDGKKDDPKDEHEPTLAEVTTATGLRNFEQINATMSALTGVPASTPAVRDVYNRDLTTALPTENDVKAFVGSQQVAVFKLAVEYCDALVKNTTLRGQVFPGFNFAAAPASALNAAGKQLLATQLLDRFWGKGLESLPPRADSEAMVVGVIDGLLAGKNANAAAVTPAVVTGTCTAVLSAAPVTLF
jgi:hypothetical protein